MNEERKILVEEVDSVEKPKLAKVEDAVDTPFVSSEVERPDDGEQSVSTALDTNGKAETKPAPVMAPSPYEAESDAAKLNRKKDYLEGFLAQKPTEAPAGEAGGDLYEAVIDTLKSIFDPEIPVNIYDLGLVYTIEIDAENAVRVMMTLTAPGCPVAGEMPGWLAEAIEPLPGVKQVDVEMTFDPPWGMDMMSDEARLELGFM